MSLVSLQALSLHINYIKLRTVDPLQKYKFYSSSHEIHFSSSKVLSWRSFCAISRDFIFKAPALTTGEPRHAW